MPTFNGGFEIDGDDEIELLEIRHKRRTRKNLLEPNHSNSPPKSQTLATSSHQLLFGEILDNSHSKTLSKNNENEEANAMSKTGSEDEIMTDPAVELAEKSHINLPSLNQLLPEDDHTSGPDENIERPYYDDWVHCKGFVAWWDNRTGRGLIVDHRYRLEHKIELKDIKWSNYGALVPGSMVEYEYSDDGISKGFSKFWVVSGCEYVL